MSDSPVNGVSIFLMVFLVLLTFMYSCSYITKNEKDHLYFLIIRLFMCVGEIFDG